MQTRHPQPLGFPSIRFGFWPIWTRCYETLRGLLGCRSCDRGLVVPYRSHGLADQELHVLILQSCWATSTPETFSTISSVRQPKAILACGESNFAGREVSVTWLGTMTPFSHWVPPSSQFNCFLASSFFRCKMVHVYLSVHQRCRREPSWGCCCCYMDGSGINFAKNIKMNVAVLGESTWHAVNYRYKAFSQKML